MTKKLFTSLSLLSVILIALSFGSCSKDDDVAESYLRINPTELTFSWKDSSQIVNIESPNQSWNITKTVNWITLSQTSGNGSSTPVTISVTSNNTGKERSAVLAITGSQGETKSLSITQTGCSPVQIDAVDLGLPSGTLWGNKNIGATSPEDYGYCFYWGSTQVMTASEWYKIYPDIKEKYWDKKILEPEDDAAYVILGSEWRIPSEDECNELIKNCSWSLTKVNGVNCYIVKGPNGNTITLPMQEYYGEVLTRNCGVAWFEDWFKYLYACHFVFETYESMKHIVIDYVGNDMDVITPTAVPVRAVKYK